MYVIFFSLILFALDSQIPLLQICFIREFFSERAEHYRHWQDLQVLFA